jgi:glycosyltransferase involved in cell wall biosynthesis
MLSGNCAHSFDCERWITGCGACPDISIYPGIRRDATAYNWRRKKTIYARSRLYISTPCHWLMNKVRNSILMAGARDCRVIPHGIDLAVFHPGDKKAARALLGMSQTAKVLLFVANGIRQNIWKDYKTLKEAVALIDNRLQGSSIVIIALGEDAPPERIGNTEICFVPPQQDPMLVSQYYQAADIYVHASRADTFPVTILEALACSTPVVATAVGGIPEQVKGLRVHFAANEYPLFKKEQSTGILVPGGDPEALSAAISALIKDDALCRQLGEQAAHDARQCFSLERCADDYLAWYQEIIDQEKHSK